MNWGDFISELTELVFELLPCEQVLDCFTDFQITAEELLVYVRGLSFAKQC